MVEKGIEDEGLRVFGGFNFDFLCGFNSLWIFMAAENVMCRASN